MSLDRVSEQIAKHLKSLPEVEGVVEENPEPISLSESSADLFVKRLIVTWGGSKYRIEIRPTF